MRLLKFYFFVYTLLVLLQVPGFTYAQNEPPAAHNKVINLNVPIFKAELEKQKGIVLDVRTPAEFAKGHLPNAINLNYQDPGFKESIKALQLNQPYFVYCAVGGRSAKACAQLKTTGLTKVYNLQGGITAWQQAGQPVVK